jgi:hypothetical protein
MPHIQMMGKNLKTIALALLLTGSVFAANQTYTFTGTATGTLNSTPFTGASFSVVGVGDPTTVNCTLSSGNVCQLVLNAGAASFTVGGLGGGTFTAGTQLTDNHIAEGGVVAFGFTTGVDAIELEDTLSGNTAFATYNLQALFGPSLPQAQNLASGFSNTPTSAGNLTVTSLANYTFQVTAGGVVTPPTPPPPAPSTTPAPTTIILTGIGLAALVFWRFSASGRSAGGTA